MYLSFNKLLFELNQNTILVPMVLECMTSVCKTMQNLGS